MSTPEQTPTPAADPMVTTAGTIIDTTTTENICYICMETTSVISLHCRSDHCICQDCVQIAFRLAAKSEKYYPPFCCSKDEPISIDRFTELFQNDDGAEIVDVYKKREIEYRTELKHRVYCAGCDSFLLNTSTSLAGAEKDPIACSECNTSTCLKCRSSYSSGHECRIRSKDEDATLNHANEQGWKQCPRCKTMIELTEACNHVVCGWCETAFCYVCLQKWVGAHDCPQYGKSEVDADGFEIATGFHAKTGLDRNGFDRDGLNEMGFDREGVHVNDKKKKLPADDMLREAQREARWEMRRNRREVAMTLNLDPEEEEISNDLWRIARMEAGHVDDLDPEVNSEEDDENELQWQWRDEEPEEGFEEDWDSNDEPDNTPVGHNEGSEGSDESSEDDDDESGSSEGDEESAEDDEHDEDGSEADTGSNDDMEGDDRAQPDGVVESI